MIWIRFGNDIGVCAYVRKIWSQGRHFRCRDLNPKPLNVFLTPKRCSVLYFVKSVIYRTVGDILDSRWYIGQRVDTTAVRNWSHRLNIRLRVTITCRGVQQSAQMFIYAGYLDVHVEITRDGHCVITCVGPCSTSTLWRAGTLVYICNRRSTRSWHLRRPCGNVLLWNLAGEPSDGGQSIRG